MFGFRYHLVTIIAIFMALGIGILLGGSIDQDLFPKEQVALFNRLEEKYNASRAENTKWSRKVSELNRQTSQLDQALQQLGNLYVRNKLAGKKIVLVQFEKGDSAKVFDWLQSAGAQIQATVKVRDTEAFLGTSALPVLAQGLGTSGETSEATLFSLSAKSLAASITGATSASWPEFLKNKGWIDIQGHLGTRPDVVIVLGGVNKNTQSRLQWFDSPFLKEIRKQNIRVVGTERSDSESSIVPVYRNLGVPTVDNLDQASGLLSLVELINGREGNYGIKQHSVSLIPQLGSPTAGGSLEVQQP
ncbi:copper transporter [Effusibacillus consociatus]|uniref:Copper transporter n=1 Tax=Effusibacillus consociatus TaxID=1117041 RepID=A0ABV9Q9B5_9BACL